MTSSGAVHTDLPITTATELPGAQVSENRQGEVSQYTDVLEDSRRHAVDRMIANAHLLGADAIIAVRFDSSEIGTSLTEILAYGTAVKLAR